MYDLQYSFFLVKSKFMLKSYELFIKTFYKFGIAHIGYIFALIRYRLWNG